MVLCAEAGAMILPAMPAFYQLPKTLDDLADFMAGKILSALGFEHELYPPWTGQAGDKCTSTADGAHGDRTERTMSASPAATDALVARQLGRVRRITCSASP